MQNQTNRASLRIINAGDPEIVFAWRSIAQEVGNPLEWLYQGSSFSNGELHHHFLFGPLEKIVQGRHAHISDENEFHRLSKVGEPVHIPQASCVLVVHPDSGWVLSAGRRGRPDMLGFPGGKQDDGEDALTCAVREFYEEVGVKLEFPPKLVESAVDSTGFLNSLYMVTNPKDITQVSQFYSTGPKQIERDIEVGFVPYWKLMTGPFSQFNHNLLDKIMLQFSQANSSN